MFVPLTLSVYQSKLFLSFSISFCAIVYDFVAKSKRRKAAETWKWQWEGWRAWLLWAKCRWGKGQLPTTSRFCSEESHHHSWTLSRCNYTRRLLSQHTPDKM